MLVPRIDQTAFEFSGGNYALYGFQYKPGFGDAVCHARYFCWQIATERVTLQYISWIANGKTSWTLHQSLMGPDPVVQISDRPIPQEPMVSCGLFVDGLSRIDEKLLSSTSS